MATITANKESVMASPFQILSLDSDCGRYSVTLKGSTWFLVNKETSEKNRLSENMEDALHIARTFIRDDS
jgi:hypothetical protein